MSDREVRKKHLKQLEALLEGMRKCDTVVSSPNRIEAIAFAISSIKTDLKYDLMYENDEVYSKADMLSLLKDIKADIANISEKSSICDDTYCYGYRDKLASDYKTEVLEVIDKKISDMENKK